VKTEKPRAGQAHPAFHLVKTEKPRAGQALELGSGVGLAGLTAGLAGAEAVALSDFGAVEGDAGDVRDVGDVGAGAAGEGGGAGANTVVAEALQPAALLSNLAYNVARNELAGRCAPQRLDWHASLAPGFAPARRFPLVFGSPPPLPLPKTDS
jgi:predicted nicotinamide N-methyase